MSIDLDIIIHFKRPLDESAFLQIPERLKSPVFERLGTELIEILRHPGINSRELRDRYCMWNLPEKRNSGIFGLWKRETPWEKMVWNFFKQRTNFAPNIRWAEFDTYFYKNCLVMHAQTKYGAFLNNSYYGPKSSDNFQLTMRKCIHAVANAFDAAAAIYVPDSGDFPVQQATIWSLQGCDFEIVEQKLHSSFGTPPSSLSNCKLCDYFIDHFEDLALGSNLPQ